MLTGQPVHLCGDLEIRNRTNPLGGVPLCKRQSGHCDHSGSIIPSVASGDTASRSLASVHAAAAARSAHIDMTHACVIRGPHASQL